MAIPADERDQQPTASRPEPRSIADWERAAADVLRKARLLGPDEPAQLVWERLTRTTLDDVRIPPLGTAQSTSDLPPTGLPGHPPFTRGAAGSVRPDGDWDNRTVVDNPDAAVAAADALGDLETGATSLWLKLAPEDQAGLQLASLDEVLEDVYVDLAPVVLDCPADAVGAARAFAALLERRAVTPATGTNLGADLFSAALRGSAAPSDEVVGDIAELAVRHGVLGFVVDATVVHDLGGSDAQELGYATAAGAAYLRRLTAADGPALDVDTAASLLEFRFAATVEQLPTIAKLRAARRLWSRVCELSGVSSAASGQRQHAVTSRPMMTTYDPWVNMLRVTVAAFAGGVGGAQAITVSPFDAALGKARDFSRRIARHTSTLLTSESHLGAVVDPAGGAYAVELHTDRLAQAGWRELQLVERVGGIAAASHDGSLRQRIDGVGARREADIAFRRRPITGVSEFPHLHEQLPQVEPYDVRPPAVRPYAAAFEAMRDEPAPLPVFLATLGPQSSHAARATFASNLLAAGGVDVVGAGPSADVTEVVARYRGERVVCLAGSDAAYADWGAGLIAALRREGAAYVALAGAPGARTIGPDLVDDSCAQGVDAVSFLTRIREELLR